MVIFNINSPVKRLLLVLSPDGLNILQGSYTHELDKLDKLQRSVLMNRIHIICNQMLQDLYNL